MKRLTKTELWAFIESIKDYCNRDLKLSYNVSFHACGERREQVSSYRKFYDYEPADLPNGIFRLVSFLPLLHANRSAASCVEVMAALQRQHQ